MRVLSLIVAMILSASAWGQEPASEDSPPNDPVPTVPVADEAPAALPTGDEAVALEAITVTAERKVATLQETPISIEAFNAERLALRGIEGLSGIAANVPNMTAEPFPIHNATLRIFIRGAGTSDVQLTQDPAVGVYIDGVYIARSLGLAIDTADLERIEVLRGPQGTLYGRNTTGGAINLITRRPSTDAFSMSHQLTAGSRGLLLGKSSFNVPLGDSLAAKFAVLGSGQDGFVENTGPGGDFGDRKESAARFDARWLAADWLTADYSYDFTDFRYFGGLFQAITPPFTDHGLGNYFKAYAQTQTVYSENRLDSLATSVPLLESGSRIRGHALTLGVPLDTVNLKYTGAYRQLSDDQYQDLGGGMGSPEYRIDTGPYAGAAADMAYGGPTPAVTPRVEQTQASHELQLAGSLFDGTLEYIVGGFWFEEEGSEYGHPMHHILNSLADPGAMPPELSVFFTGLAAPRIVGFWDYDLGISNTAKAAFTQLTWSPDWLERRLHATAGVRQSWDERHAVKNFVQRIYAEGNTAGGSESATLIPGEVTGTNDFVDVHGDVEYDDLSPSASLRYELTPALSTYLSYSRAYKSGGYNVRDPQIDGNQGPASDGEDYGFGFAEGFRPEYVAATELGVRSEWLDRRLRLNATVFDSDLTDMQTNFLIAGSISDTKSRNVGKAHMRGLELDTTLAALPGMILSLSYAYLDADVLEVLDVNGENKAALYPFPSAPPQSGVASVDWSFFDWREIGLRAYVSWHYIGKRDGVVIAEERRDLTRLDPTRLLNARLIASGFRFGERGGLELALWGKNLTDAEYAVFAIDNTPQADRAVLWGEPRALGLDLVYRYF
ncbi:MAG TPA: TonB-dependent receptor [Verrucomicrobiae bacterium]|nr:TonB-dependent receptor [Verrucomicrobiae bacterium]